MRAGGARARDRCSRAWRSDAASRARPARCRTPRRPREPAGSPSCRRAAAIGCGLSRKAARSSNGKSTRRWPNGSRRTRSPSIDVSEGPRCARAGPIVAVIGGLGVAGIALAILEVLRTLVMLRFEARSGVAMQAAIVDRVVSAPATFFRRFSSGDLALRIGSVNTVQRTLTGAALSATVTGAFLVANAALMIAYSPALSAGSLAVV